MERKEEGKKLSLKSGLESANGEMNHDKGSFTGVMRKVLQQRSREKYLHQLCSNRCKSLPELQQPGCQYMTE